jgi:dihydroorotate dehydrogenase
MYDLVRELLFMLPSTEAHELGLGALRMLEAFAPLRKAVAARCAPPAGHEIDSLGLRFRSPIGLAGGFDKNARAPRALAALGFGFLELGTVTWEAQEPNPPPNLFRLPDDRALVNRLGFPNEGARVVADRFAREVGRGAVGIPVGFSIGKSRSVPPDDLEAVVRDYLESFRAVRTVSDFVVVNVSSPNTRGLRALSGADAAHTLLGRLMSDNREGVPLLVKLSPDQSSPDLDALLDVVSELGVSGVVASNTTTSRDGLVSRRDVVDAAGIGGLSGPTLFPRMLHVVARARAKLGSLPTIIGVGGVSTARDVSACLAAGADLVQIYTSFIYAGPTLPSRMARELSAG